MSRRRFYAPPSAFDFGEMVVTLAPDEARHLRDVLRLKRGDEAFVFDGEGREYRCRIVESGREGARLEIGEEVQSKPPESKLRLHLGVALLKGEKFDLVVQKATELGVTGIVPVLTKFADVRIRDDADAARRVVRWKRIALEAAKQSGRASLPEIAGPQPFTSVIESVAATVSECRLFFSERGGGGLDEALRQYLPALKSVAALVGPEGGWADEEIEQARASGWNIITLGGHTLRAETAAIIVAALLQHRLGDLG
ncbi:MAG TPA: 16S rRNA (uracil(1498)-N(3))-methyltransferase [Pyrinomonadaceae bacterium]